MIFIPEIRVHRVISLILESIRDNYKSVNNKKDSFLFLILKDQCVDGYDFFEQAVEVIMRSPSDPKELKVRLFFDAERAALPTIHINLPSENASDDGLGSDEGFNPTVFDDKRSTYQRVFNRSFQANYQVIFTSANSLETVLLYHVIRAAVIAYLPSLEVLGFKKLKLGGGDLILNPNIVPLTVFVRGFSMHFAYEVAAPQLASERFYKEFIAYAKPTINNE